MMCLSHAQVKLKDSLMSSVSFRQAKDAELAWIDGQINFSSATSKGIIGMGEEKMEANQTDLIPVLDAPSQNQVGLSNRSKIIEYQYRLALKMLSHNLPLPSLAII